MTRLRLSFLGPFQVILDGCVVTGFESNKVRGLLAYLAVESSRPHARETLAALFWPDHHNHSAINSLRSALAYLRSAIADRTADPPFLLITHDTIRFNPAADFRLDVIELEAGASRPVEHLELMLYEGGGNSWKVFRYRRACHSRSGC
jgi:DNA-binding SARP family transcriptional activator